MTSRTAAPAAPEHTALKPHPAFSVLVGLTSLAILLQGLWAGIFLGNYNTDQESSGWIDVHSNGAHVATVLGVLAAVVGFVTRRQRKDLWIGAAVLAVLLIVESYLGGRVKDNEQKSLLAVHVPLAMAMIGLAVWLPLRARQRG